MHQVLVSPDSTTRRPRRLGLALLAIVLSVTPLLRAQDTDSKSKALEMKLPLMVLNFASFDRAREAAGLFLQQGDQTKLDEDFTKWIQGTLKDTAGFDRTKPFGTMFFLKPGLLPGMTSIAYLPVTDKTKALDTLATVGTAQGKLKPLDGTSDSYEIDYGVGPRPKVTVRHMNGYLFILDPMSEREELERDLPDPVTLTARLTNRYDLSYAVMIKHVPPAIKTIFREYLKNQIQAQMQQRDNEPDSVYRLRRINGQSSLDLMDRIIQSAEEGTIGGRIDRDSRHAILELEIAGTPDNKLAKYFQDTSGRKSAFANLLEDPATLTVAGSSVFDVKQRKLLEEFFAAAEQDLVDRATSRGQPAIVDAARPLFKAFRAGAEAGHFDMIFQVKGETAGEYTALAALRVPGGSAFPQQVQAFLERAKELAAEDGSRLEPLEIAAESLEEVPVHRYKVTLPAGGFDRLWGPEPHVYLCVSSQAVWLAFGGDAALPTLRQAVDLSNQPVTPDLDRRSRSPMQFVTHLQKWIALAQEPEDDAPPSGASPEVLQAAFGSGGDAIRGDMLPTDTGLRLTIEFEEGSVGWLGRVIGLRRDRRQNRNRDAATPTESEAASPPARPKPVPAGND